MIARILQTVILASILGLAALPASAQPKVGTVDMKKLFDNYWKTKLADANLRDRGAEFDKKRKEMIDDASKVQKDYNAFLESSNDQAVSAAEREKRKKSAENKFLELKEIEQSVQQFDRSARTQLGEQQRSMRDKIVAEIRDAINAKAKGGAYSLILDVSADSANSAPFVLYSDGKSDVTEELLQQLNLNAPTAPAKAQETKPADKKDEKK